MKQPWPLTLEYYVIEFEDEPGAWWWTNGTVLLRGVGERPNRKRVVKPSLDLTAGLSAKRVESDWEPHSETVARATENHWHRIQLGFLGLAESWPTPIKWLVPKGKKPFAALALEIESQQIVAVVMPMRIQ